MKFMQILYVTDNSNCNPGTPTTFLFAYSNDFDADLVNKFWNFFIINVISPHYVMFGSIRFDVRDKADFVFHDNIKNVNASIMAHQPDPSLGFGDLNTGSDVLDMTDRYLNVKSVPICGSKLIIFVKRYPNQTEITQLVSKLRQYHVTFTILASYESSGGSNPEILITLASKVNGFCAFDTDSDIIPTLDHVSTVYNPYLVYTANPECSNGQVVVLPMMNIPAERYWVSITIQDSGPPSIVNTALYQWGGIQMGLLNGEKIGYGYMSGNHDGDWQNANGVANYVSLSCKFYDFNSRRLLMRVFSRTNAPTDWMPYDD